MVNPFVAGSSVLLTFIEIMETIFEEAFKRTFNPNGLSELNNFILESHSKKLEASSFNDINRIGFYRLIKLRSFRWARMLAFFIQF